jgi:hypothetical protein
MIVVEIRSLPMANIKKWVWGRRDSLFTSLLLFIGFIYGFLTSMFLCKKGFL